MKIFLPLYQFILLAISTVFTTYFFNDALIKGQEVYALFWGLFLGRNVYSSLQLSRFVRVLEAQTGKRNDRKDVKSKK